MARRFEGCLFDLYDTLVHFDEEDYGQKTGRMAAAAGVTPESFSTVWKSFVVESNLGQLATTQDRVVAVLGRLGVEIREATVQAIAGEEHAFLRDSSKLFPDAARTLEALRKAQIRTGLVTNASASVREVLRKHRLADLVDLVVVSSEVGHRKPEPEIYRIAIDGLGLDAERTAFVGDGNDRELEGAKTVGLWTIKVSRCSFRPVQTIQSTDASADHVVGTLSDALKLVTAPAA